MAGKHLQKPRGPGHLPHRIARIRAVSGLSFIIVSCVLGKVAFAALSISLYLFLSVYAISWAMFFGGLAMCGEEGRHKARSLAKRFGKRMVYCFVGPSTK